MPSAETLAQLLAELKRLTKEQCTKNCTFFGCENHSVDCLRRQQLIKMAEEQEGEQVLL